MAPVVRQAPNVTERERESSCGTLSLFLSFYLVLTKKRRSAAYFYNVTYPLGTVYTVELRDTGAFGFLLPADEIRPTAIESIAALKVYARHVLEVDRKRAE